MPVQAQLPDGTTLEFPDGTPDEVIDSAVKQHLGAGSRSTMGTFFNRLTSGVANTALKFPGALVDVAGAMRADPKSLSRLFTGGDGRIQDPTVQDISAGIRSVPSLFPGGESPSEAFQKNKADIIGQEQTDISAHPIASLLGDVGSDVATIALGRLPFRGAISNAEQSLMKIPPVTSAAQWWKNLLLNKPVRSLLRGAGRSAEAGLEAAALDIIKGDDPLETAAYAAATQAGGSMALALTQLKLGRGFGTMGKIAASAGGFFVLLEMSKAAIPGSSGPFSSIESIGDSFKKVVYGMLIGGLAGSLGLGRMRGSEMEKWAPIFSDVVTSIPRGATISMLERLVDSGEGAVNQASIIAETLMKDPSYFGEQAGKRLANSMSTGRFDREIDNLMEQEDFRNRVFALIPPEIPQ